MCLALAFMFSFPRSVLLVLVVPKIVDLRCNFIPFSLAFDVVKTGLPLWHRQFLKQHLFMFTLLHVNVFLLILLSLR